MKISLSFFLFFSFFSLTVLYYLLDLFNNFNLLYNENESLIVYDNLNQNFLFNLYNLSKY